jgi:predicted AAA+ superfamily ATPase
LDGKLIRKWTLTINLNPFTESEKEQTPGAFLEYLIESKFTNEAAGQVDEFPADELPRRIVTGSFPAVLWRSPASASRWYRTDLMILVKRDIAEIRDTGEVTKLFELLSQRTASLLNVTNLSRDLNADRAMVGKYLGIFVVQQIIAQAQWTDPSLRFCHYREKDQVEVDLVIERGSDVWGVEVKASESITEKDGAGLRRLAKLAGKNFRGGFLIYNGSMTWNLPSDKRFMAVPVSKFWTL